MIDVKVLLGAYKALKDNEKKQKALDKMAAAPINYAIIRDLINSAYQGVSIEVTFKDGTHLDIKRDERFFAKPTTNYEAF